MKKTPQKNADMQKIADLIDSIGPGMLTTPDETGRLCSRPMMPLEMDSNGCIWFFTKSEANKTAAPGQMNLAFARPDAASYVSVSGSSTLVHDRSKIEDLWSPLMKAWFPEGKDDPSLALLRVDVDTAEYWDSNSSKMVRLLAMVASAVKGEPVGMGENRTVVNPAAVANTH